MIQNGISINRTGTEVPLASTTAMIMTGSKNTLADWEQTRPTQQQVVRSCEVMGRNKHGRTRNMGKKPSHTLLPSTSQPNNGDASTHGTKIHSGSIATAQPTFHTSVVNGRHTPTW